METIIHDIFKAFLAVAVIACFLLVIAQLVIISLEQWQEWRSNQRCEGCQRVEVITSIDSLLTHKQNLVLISRDGPNYVVTWTPAGKRSLEFVSTTLEGAIENATGSTTLFEEQPK